MHTPTNAHTITNTHTDNQKTMTDQSVILLGLLHVTGKALDDEAVSIVGCPQLLQQQSLQHILKQILTTICTSMHTGFVNNK